MREDFLQEHPRHRELVERVVAIILFALLAAVLGHTFMGHANSPYGVCYGPSGRSIPCSITQKARASHR
jgi:hypothetical protein